MNILFGLVLGVIGYFVALIVFNPIVSALIGILIGLVAAFGWPQVFRR